MSESSLPPSSVPQVAPVSPVLIVVGILFIVGWILVSITVVAMSLMGTLMANDSSAASTDSHSALILGVLVSQIITGISGIPGGLAFFWRTKRRLMVLLFIGLFVLGVLGQVAAFMSFLPGGSPES
ncbi:hypothetical protein EI77_01423 [Prosthecobacter fusiformis]|uniref:Uncharacterized protein n=1 Tax=Prosthecobacter fusiformis TaxID=48464 RepID=A0A4R7S6X4_9BACT|nr:hypothetical protein [Prosthecobacter fusiformis]TDU72957.1 hypothetical protein EI77_01423 [Prosthecobacter fusiformis]